MTTSMTMAGSPLWRWMRWLVWGGAAGLLLLPWVAMQYTDEVAWTAADFIVMGGLLGLAGVAFEVALRVARSHAYVVAAGVAVAAAFLLTWVNLAVGIIGNEGNPANGIFFAVLAVGLLGVLLSRGQAAGMARAMEATAIAQALAALATAVLAEGYVFLLAGAFVLLWLLSAQLLRQAARQQAGAANS